MSNRWSRVARGFAVGSAASYVAVFAHIVGGGEPPSWLGIVATLALSTAICTALAGRNLRMVQTTAGVVASQFLFHTLFSVAAPSSVASSAHSPGHTHHATVTLALGADLPVHDMTVAHGASAAATLAILYAMEAAFAWVRAIAHRLGEFFTRSIRFALPRPRVGRPLFHSWPDVGTLTARASSTAAG